MPSYGAATHVGNVRDNNEDSFAADEDKHLWVVADGMGGLGFGEVASAISIHSVVRLVRQGHGVNQAIEIAHNRIKQYANTDAEGTNMGTTLVLLLSQGSLYNVFWVGDSRAYLYDSSLKQNRLRQITVDHSLVQSLIESGQLSQEDARNDRRKNAITRALGVQELDTVRADSVSNRWAPGQKIILCSDGLTDCVTDENIEAILATGGDEQEVAERLISRALRDGGRDNVTVVVVSAPMSVRGTEGDTEIPGDTTGSYTRRPQDTATAVPGPPAEDLGATTRVERQPAPTDDATERPGDPAAASPAAAEVDQQPNGARLNLLLLVVITIALIAAIVVLVDTEPQAGLESSPALNGRIDAETLARVHAPAVAPHFPGIELKHGLTLTAGTFKELANAEARQKELLRNGIDAFVEKPPLARQPGFIVYGGPFADESRRKEAVARLAAAGIPAEATPDAPSLMSPPVTGATGQPGRGNTPNLTTISAQTTLAAIEAAMLPQEADQSLLPQPADDNQTSRIHKLA